MTDENKYPLSIQKLFKPKLPFKYITPNDFPPQLRRTPTITPVSDYKSYIDTYDDYISKKRKSRKSQPAPSLQKINKAKRVAHHHQLKINADLKKQQKLQSFNKQMDQWNDPEFLQNLESNGILKDPYKTVFLGRLPYEIINEKDLYKYFEKFGQIESLKIVKDLEGKSRGYGFLVFESSYQAKQCVTELCKTGLKLDNDKRILIDYERSRIMRNFKPRRLGGGEGGRGYKKIDKYSSVAATARRMNIANNPNIQPPIKRSYQGQNFQPHHYHPHHQNYQSARQQTSVPSAPLSMKDKYAKYM